MPRKSESGSLLRSTELPRFKPGQLIRHKFWKNKNYYSIPSGVCMVLSVHIDPLPSRWSNSYKLLIPEGSNTYEDDSGIETNRDWSAKYIDEDYEEVKDD